ncbi:MAG: MinD/ParA family protein [Zetaproteobacteria bacterium]|nr:MinD/ParA family protein [Zetaproteobacteria bacterium]
MTKNDEDNISPRVIAISSGKGGVGKTFFSIHLAVKAVRQGLRVLLLDADLGMANVDVMLGISGRGSVKQVLAGRSSLSEVLIHAKQGFDVLPGGSGFAELSALSSNQQQILMDEMREAAKDYDLVLIDTAAGIGDNVLFFVASAESSLVVLTPDPTSLTDAYALIKVLSQQRDVHRFMVLVNQVDAFEGELTFRRLMSVADRYLDVQLDYVGCMPSSKDVQRAVQHQQLLEHGEAYKALDATLKTVLSRPRDDSRQGGLQFFWEHSLGQSLSEEQTVGVPV